MSKLPPLYREECHLHNALSTMQSAAKSPAVVPSDTLMASRNWATVSLKLGDITFALQAFPTVIEILPQVAWLGSDVASRQDWAAKEKVDAISKISKREWKDAIAPFVSYIV